MEETRLDPEPTATLKSGLVNWLQGLLQKKAPASRDRKKRIADWVLAHLIFSILHVVRLLPSERGIQFGGWFGRRVLAPLSPANWVGLENLRYAFPDLGEAERRRILADCWDNLGRTCVEYLHLKEFAAPQVDNTTYERFELDGSEDFSRLSQLGGPAIICSAHLGNWEMLPAWAASNNLDLSVLFRPPNNPHISERLMAVRNSSMGPLISSKERPSVALSAVLERGGHVGLMVDQHFGRGVIISFLGRPALTNPMLGMLVRRFECPVYAARCIRLPQGRFRLELTGPIDMPRDQSGAIDVLGAMQKVTGIIEGWVRENPGQWLWIHRRWRPEAMQMASASIRRADQSDERDAD